MSVGSRRHDYVAAVWGYFRSQQRSNLRFSEVHADLRMTYLADLFFSDSNGWAIELPCRTALRGCVEAKPDDSVMAAGFTLA